MTLVTYSDSSHYCTHRFDFLYVSLNEALIKKDQKKIFEVFLRLQRDMAEESRADNYFFQAIILDVFGHYDLCDLSKVNFVIDVGFLAALINKYYEFFQMAKKLPENFFTYKKIQSILFTPEDERQKTAAILDKLSQKNFLDGQKLILTIPEGECKNKLAEVLERNLKENSHQIAQEIKLKNYLAAFSLSQNMPRGVGLDSLLLRIGCRLVSQKSEKVQEVLKILSSDTKRKELSIHIKSKLRPRTIGLWKFQRVGIQVDQFKPACSLLRSEPKSIVNILEQVNEKLTSILKDFKFKKVKKILFNALSEQLNHLSGEFLKKKEADQKLQHYQIILIHSPLYKKYKKYEIHSIYFDLAIMTSNITSCINEIFLMKDMAARSKLLTYIEQFLVYINHSINNIQPPSINEIVEYFKSKIWNEILKEESSEYLLGILKKQLRYMKENFDICKLLTEFSKVQFEFDLKNSPIFYKANSALFQKKYMRSFFEFFDLLSEGIRDACLISESPIRKKNLESYEGLFFQLKNRMRLGLILSRFAHHYFTLTAKNQVPYQDIISKQAQNLIEELYSDAPFSHKQLIDMCNLEFIVEENKCKQTDHGFSKQTLKVIQEAFIGIINQFQKMEGLLDDLSDEFVIICVHYLKLLCKMT